MKKITFNLFVLFILVFPALSFPHDLQAREMLFGTDLNFSNQTVAENHYIAGGNVNIDSIFEDDLIVTGGRVNITGQVLGDALIIGGEINLTNYVAGDLRIFGGRVNLSSTIDGDLVVIGGTVILNNDAAIKGETIIIGGEVKQNAALTEKSDIVAASIFINNELSGDTDITTQNIVFSSGAKVTGDLSYYAPQKGNEMSGSKISGTVNFNQIKTIRETGFVKTAIINVLSFWMILKFITTLIIAFVLIQLFKVFTQGVNDIAVHSFAKSFVVGLLSIILVPAVFVILMISLIGLPVGLLLLLIYTLIVSISGAFSGIIVGSLVSGMTGQNPEHKVGFKHAAIGIILLTTLQFIDWIGDITILIFGLVSIGAILRYVIKNVFGKK